LLAAGWNYSGTVGNVVIENIWEPFFPGAGYNSVYIAPPNRKTDYEYIAITRVSKAFGSYKVGVEVSINGLYPNGIPDAAVTLPKSPNLANYPTYKEYPNVPDFGAIFGMTTRSEIDTASMINAYIYYPYDGDANVRDPLSRYIEILEECGYVGELVTTVTGNIRIHYFGYGYSVAISFNYDAKSLYPDQALRWASFSVVIQKDY
jgi:hypothetical protein